MLATAIAVAVLVGCGAETSPSSASAATTEGAPAAAKSSVDAGGHPLSSVTDDPGTLGFETELLRLVNEYRAARGLQPLADSTSVRAAARAHSQHMAMHRFFSHTSPEGLAPGDRLSSSGIDWGSVGENIAAGYASPQAVLDAWLASPGHRKNIESETWTHAGVGYAIDPAPTDDAPHVYYWTQDFVRR